ncbi:MAG: sugar ABC transporter ATP-binding protein [Chlamydiae bacterium]|nr:MAG: sugar ABC transporter ATP-binding protein [Chlamydiota bacterium]
MTTIELEKVALTYPVYGTNSRSLKNSIINLATGGRLNRSEKIVKIEALRNIDLKLKAGDRLGLIGHNGAGKTTLLKVLAQIYEPTEGRIKILGRANCLFDIMIGMDQGLTGYENIMLRGLLLGLSKQEIEHIIPSIEEFSELGEFLNIPLKSYSSGMLVRLAFGIITSIHSDILLIDEVVSVGDSRFIEKAKSRITSLIHQTDIVVLSTHDHQMIKEFCNKIIRLEKGSITSYEEVDHAR